MSNIVYRYAIFEVYTILKKYNLEKFIFQIEKIIIDKVLEDLKILSKKNPAIENHDVALFYHLGFKSILYYRIANALLSINNDFELISKKISEDSKILTGVEIHPKAYIEGGVVIDHGIGTVIGETTKIYKGTYILQNVILGATGIANNSKNKRHPTIGKNVEIGANVKILGNVKIGDNVFIGPDIIITEDIPSNTVVYYKTQKLYKKIKDLNRC